jgi:hypothetical protein
MLDMEKKVLQYKIKLGSVEVCLTAAGKYLNPLLPIKIEKTHRG